MSQLNNKRKREATPSGKPVKPKKPLPTRKGAEKVPVPCSVLTEERVREIAREEALKYVPPQPEIFFAPSKKKQAKEKGKKRKSRDINYPDFQLTE
jgi:hypothetical protein